MLLYLFCSTQQFSIPSLSLLYNYLHFCVWPVSVCVYLCVCSQFKLGCSGSECVYSSGSVISLAFCGLSLAIHKGRELLSKCDKCEFFLSLFWSSGRCVQLPLSSSCFREALVSRQWTFPNESRDLHLQINGAEQNDKEASCQALVNIPPYFFKMM